MKLPVLHDDNNWYDVILQQYGHCRGILFIVGIVWFVPALISTVRGYPLVLDYATNMRTLVSLPLFILSSKQFVKKANWILQHFVSANIIRDDEREKFKALVVTSNRILNSSRVKFILVAVVFIFIGFEIIYAEPVKLVPWRNFSNPGCWWFYLISHPIYSYLLVRFLLKVGLWWLLLFKISRMRLVLRGAHGDGVGGLGFLSTSLNSLIFPGLAFSSTGAAGAANLLIYGDMTLNGLKVAFTIFVTFLIIALIGPLFLFTQTLIKEREESIFKYGVLSSEQMTQFENKWFVKREEEDALGTGDFSSTTDYNAEVERVHSIRFVPIKIVDVVALLIAISIPFAPVFALKMPWQDVLKHMLSILR